MPALFTRMSIAPICFLRLLNQGRNRSSRVTSALQGQDLDSRPVQGRYCLFKIRLFSGAIEDSRAHLAEAAGNGQADTAAGARNQGHLA